MIPNAFEVSLFILKLAISYINTENIHQLQTSCFLQKRKKGKPLEKDLPL
jgi:hypothetical protein